MLISSIRHKISSELDARRSVSFSRYLMHYLRMFALLGTIIPVFLGIDYFCSPKTKDKIVVNKYYQVVDNLNDIEYHFFTDSYNFLSSVGFYENTNIGDKIILQYTPIFNTVTHVSRNISGNVYTCNPKSIYSWLFIIVVLTFICSIIIVFKTWGWIKKREYIKYDSLITLGVINSFLCLITILTGILHITY